MLGAFQSLYDGCLLSFVGGTNTDTTSRDKFLALPVCNALQLNIDFIKFPPVAAGKRTMNEISRASNSGPY